MEEILKQILSELKGLNDGQVRLETKVNHLEKDQKEFRQEINEKLNDIDVKLTDLDNRTITLQSDIKEFSQETGHEFNIVKKDITLLIQQFPVIDKKSDRQTAKLDRVSSAIKEHDIRLEDLEGLKI